MSKVVYDFSAELDILSPLHIGSGAFGTCPGVAGKDGGNTTPQVALKGLYRRILEAEGPLVGAALDLVGEIKRDGGGRIGAIRARPAVFISAPDVSTAPFVEASSPRDGVFVAARTRVDRDTGTAGDSYLYFQETVAPGTRFRLTAVIEGRDGDASAVARTLARVWRRLCEPNGCQIGKGQTDGSGAIRLRADTVTVTRRMLDAAGDFTPQPAPEIWQDADTLAGTDAVASVAVELLCEGPFIIVDASRKRKRKPGDPPSDTAQVRPQTLADKPLVLGSSISGALRARAEWLEALALEVRTDRDRGLTPSQRLFGVTGFRALLSVTNIQVSSRGKKELTSVKLDRFSGAPVDNALFKTEAFIGVRLAFDLQLAKRGRTAPTQDDLNLFQRLKEDIGRQGLMLGHGTNKGFGWFEAVGDSVHADH